jgi:hypothetical protein
MLEKFKSLLQNTTVFLAFILILVACSAFFLGRLSVVPNQTVAQADDRIMLCPTTICPAVNNEAPPAAVLGATTPTVSETVTQDTASAPYVASRAGTKYHHISCPGAKQIKPENKIFFATKSAAEAAGYSPAANCKL